jgi:hypothetical protein
VLFYASILGQRTRPGRRRRQQQQEGENSSGAHFNSAAAGEEVREVLNKPGEEEVQLVYAASSP